MKKLFFLFAIVLAGCNTMDSKNSTGVLAPKKFATQLKSDPEIVLIDVRSSAEMQTGYIEGTQHLDFNSPGFKNSLDSLDHSKTYFLYCASGKRSGKALEMMNEMGFKNVAALDGGLRMWNATGLPMHQPQN